jgi:hypothetical protein
MTRRLELLDPGPLLALFPGATDGEIADRTGVSRHTVLRWRHGTTALYPATADRIAVRLGLHPANLWGDAWWTGAAVDVADVRPGRRPAPTRPARRSKRPTGHTKARTPVPVGSGTAAVAS